MREIGVYRVGALPLPPTKNLFEKRFLELQKPSKSIIYEFFAKVLEGGLGGTS